MAGRVRGRFREEVKRVLEGMWKTEWVIVDPVDRVIGWRVMDKEYLRKLEEIMRVWKK